jgi:putative Holliday junction resolvase
MSSILGLDVGEARIGVALANSVARLASPYTTLANTDSVLEQIHGIIKQEAVGLIVVGLPRNLSGEDTSQTRYCRNFGERLAPFAEVTFQDEALTSHKAEAELKMRGKVYDKGDIDSLAATYILEDYLNDKRNIQ